MSASGGRMSNNPECVMVAVRIRPMAPSEEGRGCQSVVEISPPNEPQVVICGGRTKSDIFTYNYAFAPDASQALLYERSVAPVLGKLYEGYNVTILAYGQTGSGKTYTMGTDFSGDMVENAGVIPRAILDIFRKVEETDGSISTSCSFVELYQENVYDLLSEKNTATERQTVEIREMASGIVVLQGLTEIPVRSVAETFDCLVRGSSGRMVRATAMNAVSSRSHSIFTITLQQPSTEDPKSLLTSKFHLVDLAGSERSKKTKTTGDGFREGVKINQGLLALGNVISALGTAVTTGSNNHVPYRDSKLTRLLQDSLGGNSYTLMIACVSPADYNLNETISTLRYADRVRKIKNKPIVNQDPHLAKIKQLEAIIQDLRMEILTLKGGDSSMAVASEFRVPKVPSTSARPSGAVGPPPKRPTLAASAINSSSSMPSDGAPNGVRKSALQELLDKNQLLQAQLQAMAQDLATNEMRALAAEKTLEMLDEKVDDDKDIREHLGSILSTYHEEMVALGMTEPPVTAGTVGDPASQRPSIASSVLNSASSEPEPIDMPLTEDGQKRSDNHTQQQIRLHKELRQLNMELKLKEELHRRCMGNIAAVQSNGPAQQQMAEVLAEYQLTITTLEQQLAELNGQLENTKAIDKRSKLSEERRKKVQQLEAQLSELRTKSMRQAKLLKLKEKDAQRIETLSTEIQSMKATRVKLLKTMRAESDSFRKWRLTHEKEICQLKAKDRKRQNELQTMESMYAKQKKIMQRKMEETIAVNKRLKAALDRRQQRNDGKGGTGPTGDRSMLRGTEAIRWIEQELELLYSMVEASDTLEVLMEQRTQHAAKLAGLKASKSKDPATIEEIHQCEKEMALRNAQISDLQQRGHDIDGQLVLFSKALDTLPEKREAYRRLLAASVADRKQLSGLRFQLVECQAANECLEESLAQLRTDQQQTEQQYAVQVAELEKAYEDKLALLLLHQQQRTPARKQKTAEGEEETEQALQQQEETETGQQQHTDNNNVLVEAIERIEMLRNELELHKEANRLLQRQLTATKEMLAASNVPRVSGNRKPKPKVLSYVTKQEEEDEEDEEEEDDDDDDDDMDELERERDPDFRGTPISKRRKMSTVSLVQSQRSIDSDTNETSNSSGTGPHCTCTGNCSTMRCGCRKSGLSCQSSSCKCPENCANKALESISEDTPSTTEDEKENTFAISGGDGDSRNLLEMLCTPKQNKRAAEMDILTYVSAHRKLKPLLND
ncbi:chromosome-associated kinesin KIF4A-like [Anopheles darlingi]|uniref:chromosome-associated kinesin KIF4A-like n=1 Tax=Anopheles darlingi TaxID=43151 RepID=UPI00210059C9|nr:chromosome-associated kinesin KIF4A-like [Anopheles darlingi]